MSRVDEIRERLEKATPGPWKWITKGNTVQSRAITTDTGECGIQKVICASISPKTGDADLISNAPSDIAYLLSELDKAEKERDAAEILNDELLIAFSCGEFCRICKHKDIEFTSDGNSLVAPCCGCQFSLRRRSAYIFFEYRGPQPEASK